MPKITDFSLDFFKKDDSVDQGGLINRNNTPCNLLETLYYTGSREDIYAGYQYAIDKLLPENVDLTQLNAEALYNHLLELNKRMAKHQTWLEGLGQEPGNIRIISCCIPNETGVQGLNFDGSFRYSTHNYQILERTQGKKTAEDYKSFCHKLIVNIHNEAILAANKMQSPYEKQQAALNELLMMKIKATIAKYQLDEQPDYYAYAKVLNLGTPASQIKAEMLKALRITLRLMQKGKYTWAAAFLIKEISRIHPFVAGNGKVSRLMANCILMQGGQQPVSFADFDKSGYYMLIQKAIISDEHLKTLHKVIKTASKHNQDNLKEDKLSELHINMIAGIEKLPMPRPVGYQIHGQYYIFLEKHLSSINMITDALKQQIQKNNSEKVLQLQNLLTEISELAATPEYLISEAAQTSNLNKVGQQWYMVKLAINNLEQQAEPDTVLLATAYLDAAHYALKFNNRKVSDLYFEKACSLIAMLPNDHALHQKLELSKSERLNFNPYTVAANYIPNELNNILNCKPAILPANKLARNANQSSLAPSQGEENISSVAKRPQPTS